MVINNLKENEEITKGYKGLGMEGFIARWYANIKEDESKQNKFVYHHLDFQTNVVTTCVYKKRV